MLFSGEEAKPSVTVRPYQEEMDARVMENIFQRGHRGTLVVAPMGAGKSLTMALTAIRASDKSGKGVLILAHYRGLVRGNKKAVEQLGRECYIYCGDEKTVLWSNVKNHGAIVSASVQALGKALHKIDPASFGIILIDEGHHAIVDSEYHKIQKHFGCPVVLYSATPDRADGVSLVSDEALCESVAYNGQVRRFVKEGWILEPKIRYETTVNMDWTLLDSGGGEVTEREAEKIWESNKANFAVIKPMIAASGDMPTVGFAPSVKLAKLWAHLINDDKPDRAEYVASYKPGNYTDAKLEFSSSERRLIEERFNARITQYLINQGVYLEGADLVVARFCMMGIITSSRPKYVQAIGRVLRPENDQFGMSILAGLERASASARLEKIASSGKPWALVVDYAGSSGVNKLAHPVDLYGYGTDMKPEVRERVKKVMEEKAGRDSDEPMSLEEIIQDQEEAYKSFLVRDARVRKSILVDCETVTRDIDPWGEKEVTGGQRYAVRKINPPAPSVIDQIQKAVKELGRRPYSDDFWRSLTNAKAFGVLNGLRKAVAKERASLPCPQWITDKLASRGIYDQPSTKAAGIALLKKSEKQKT